LKPVDECRWIKEMRFDFSALLLIFLFIIENTAHFERYFYGAQRKT